MSRLTNDQFDALAELMRLRQSPSREATRLVFVDGLSQADAARATGLSIAAVNNRVRSTRHALELVRAVQQ